MKFLSKQTAVVIAVSLSASFSFAQSDEAFWKAASAEFKGVTLHGITESTPASNYVSDILARQFEDLTGIRVDIETTSWDQMYDKAIKDMEANTGIYDMIYIEQDIVYAYLSRSFLVNITEYLNNNSNIKAPSFSEDLFTTFVNYFRDQNDGGLYGIPMEAFIKPYLYRTDLFNDAEIKAQFKEKTGHELQPAKTPEEYAEIARFFTDYGKENDMNLWGTTAQAHTGHPASWYEFFETIAPMFGVYNWGIDKDNNYSASVANGGSMNSDKAKAALKWWLEMRDIAPPESVQSTWTETATTFAAGRVAQGLIYGENAAWIASDDKKSRVVGNVGVVLPPLEDGVLEQAESGQGYIGYYDGGAFGLPVSSKNKDATLLFLQYIAQQEVQADWTLASSRVTHNSTYDNAEVQALNDELGGYFDLIKDNGNLFAGAPPYPFHAQVREATAPILYQILTGNIESDEGLDMMAEKAEEELLSLGYRK